MVTGRTAGFDAFTAACASVEEAWQNIGKGEDVKSIVVEVRRLVTETGIDKLLHSGTRQGDQSMPESTCQDSQPPRKARRVRQSAAGGDDSATAESTDGKYILDFISRKLILGLNVTNIIDVDWEGVDMETLMLLSADMTGFLGSVDKSWSAATLSGFLFGRRDWALFASMYTCLMKDYTDNIFEKELAKKPWRKKAVEQEREDLLTRLSKGSYLNEAREFKASHGVTPCPFYCLTALAKRDLLVYVRKYVGTA